MNIYADRIVFPLFKRAIRFERIRHAYGVGVWFPEYRIFPNRIIIGIGIIITIEWIKQP
jgi:hypothetical protein